MASGGEQKVVLITGCSSGIGLRIAVLLARDELKRYHGKRAHLRSNSFSDRTFYFCLEYFTTSSDSRSLQYTCLQSLLIDSIQVLFCNATVGHFHYITHCIFENSFVSSSPTARLYIHFSLAKSSGFVIM